MGIFWGSSCVNTSNPQVVTPEWGSPQVIVCRCCGSTPGGDLWGGLSVALWAAWWPPGAGTLPPWAALRRAILSQILKLCLIFKFLHSQFQLQNFKIEAGGPQIFLKYLILEFCQNLNFSNFYFQHQNFKIQARGPREFFLNRT